MTENLIDTLEATLRAPKEYADLVADGVAMERLQQNTDFRRYQRLLAEAYLKLIERLRLAESANLPALQGALIAYHAIMNLPAKTLETAARLVERNRADSKAGISEE